MRKVEGSTRNDPRVSSEVLGELHEPEPLPPELHMPIHRYGDHHIHLVRAQDDVDILSVHQASLVEFATWHVLRYYVQECY